MTEVSSEDLRIWVVRFRNRSELNVAATIEQARLCATPSNPNSVQVAQEDSGLMIIVNPTEVAYVREVAP